ncbi:MAG TPA: ATP-binding protein [Casimicrobiaceae bacterium]|jgi:dedicated sortase system histidine kinase
MSKVRIALGIRAQLLLVLTVFLAIPWLGYEYVRELERFLRDAQEKTLAGTAQAVATALHDRPRLFDAPAAPRESLVVERSQEATAADFTAATSAPPVAPAGGSGGSAEIAQIVQGLSRTTARIFVIDRELNVLARAGSLKRPSLPDAQAADSGAARVWQWLERETLHPLYALVLKQPSEDFGEEQAGRVALPAREVDGALSGILTVDRRPTPDGKAVIVSAAHPIWVGDQVKGAVIVEETTNAVLAERNRAFERLFSIVLAALLLGSVALTLYAARLSARIRRLRDEAEAAIDAHGRVRGVLAGSDAGDEIGDLSRSFSSVLSRLAQYASYREQMASRLSHELRTPIAVVRSSLDNLKLSPLPDDARVYMERAQQGLTRLTHILTRMTEATRLEQSVGEDERERFDLGRVVTGCVDGYRVAYPQHTLQLELPAGEVIFNGAPEMIAQMLDKLVANAVEFSAAGTPIVVRLERGDTELRLSVENQGPLLPDAMRGRLFDSMVSVRGDQVSDAPHLGLGLYIVRLIAEAHGGHAMAQNRDDGRGVVVSVTLPYAAMS